MARKVILTCDECHADIKDYHQDRAIATEIDCGTVGKSLAFKTWDDEIALKPETLHFHTDNCANRYLDTWLFEQRQAAEKREAEAKLPAVEPPVIDGHFAEVAAAPVQELDSAKPAETDIPF